MQSRHKIIKNAIENAVGFVLDFSAWGKILRVLDAPIDAPIDKPIDKRKEDPNLIQRNSMNIRHKNNNLSVIIPYSHNEILREQNLEKTLDCVFNQKYKDFELIVVEQLIKPYEHIIPIFQAHTNINRIQLKDPLNRNFNKSWCINVAVKQAKSNNILVIDADMLFGDTYFEEVLKFAQLNTQYFSGYHDIICLPGRDNPATRVKKYDSIQAAGGAWFINKDFFNKVGGMNENYFGYGGEDNDMWLRVSNILQDIKSISYPLTHQYHHWHQQDGVNPLCEDRMKILDKTRKHPMNAISLLVRSNQGNINAPTTSAWNSL